MSPAVEDARRGFATLLRSKRARVGALAVLAAIAAIAAVVLVVVLVTSSSVEPPAAGAAKVVPGDALLIPRSTTHSKPMLCIAAR